VRACVCLCACAITRPGVCVCAPSPFSALTAALRRSDNQIGDDGAAALISSLEGLTALNTLYL
jgi:hypothetical protein